MSGYESFPPEDEVADAALGAGALNITDLVGDDRPVDEAAAAAHDVQPDDEKPVLNPDPVADPYEEETL